MSRKETSDLTKQLNDFKLAHYKNADFEDINVKFEHLFNRFNRLKDKKKQNRAVLDLYVLYLQSMETLFINAYASSVSVDRFPSALFITSTNLRKFISENFTKTTKFSNWFFTNQIFFIQAGDKDKNERFLQYANLIKECAKDYLDNYDLLNAYKHGFRVNAKHDKTVLTLVTKNHEQFKLNESDSTIVYFSKENKDGAPVIIEHSLNFKIGGIFGKGILISTLLNNLKGTIIYHYEGALRGKNVARFSIEDKKKWSQGFGGSHFRRPIFSLKK
jgi:hypothetical protein